MNKKKLYKEIAKKHGVTWQEVRADMESALQQAYENPNSNILNLIRQNEVEKKGEIPTPEEFIRFGTQKILTEQKNAEKKDG